MSTQIMLDLETLGTKPGCVVLAIGAVVFDPETGGVGGEGKEFLCYLDPEMQVGTGLTIDAGTVLWWLRQSDEARAAIVDAQLQPFTQALVGFSEWLEAVSGQDLDDSEYLNVQVWGNGANFDAPMLRELYVAAGLRCPWGFWDEPCYRTMRRELQGLLGSACPNEPGFEGTRHNALDDAKHQARVLVDLTRAAQRRDTTPA